MTHDQAYQASLIKRPRSTRPEVEARRAALYTIVRDAQPATVRQIYYQATVHGVVDKTASGYDKIQDDLVKMRRAGDLPYRWLADNTRWQRKPRTYTSIQQALDETARHYRKALWSDVDAYVEVWLEKDALAGVLIPVTSEYDVPLMVARGYASLSFLHGAAEYIASLDVPVFIYHLGDYDPSGVNAGEKIEQTLKEMAPKADISFRRIGVTPQQIVELALPSRLTKTSDSRSKGFGDISVELDAIHPDTLRAIVRTAIEEHLPAFQLRILQIVEESERILLRERVDQIGGFG